MACQEVRGGCGAVGGGVPEQQAVALSLCVAEAEEDEWCRASSEERDAAFAEQGRACAVAYCGVVVVGSGGVVEGGEHPWQGAVLQERKHVLAA